MTDPLHWELEPRHAQPARARAVVRACKGKGEENDSGHRVHSVHSELGGVGAASVVTAKDPAGPLGKGAVRDHVDCFELPGVCRVEVSDQATGGDLDKRLCKKKRKEMEKEKKKEKRIVANKAPCQCRTHRITVGGV